MDVIVLFCHVSSLVYNSPFWIIGSKYGPPVRPPGIMYDSIGYRNTVEKIRTLAARTKSQVWFGHDGNQFNEVRKSTEGYYE